MQERGEGRDVFGCALMRAPAGTACLPCTLHLFVVACLAWKLLFLRKRMCCNATSELLLHFD
jgi:hypothetical protein